jgi:hypothetical protein
MCPLINIVAVNATIISQFQRPGIVFLSAFCGGTDGLSDGRGKPIHISWAGPKRISEDSGDLELDAGPAVA